VPQSRSGRSGDSGREKNILLLLRLEPLFVVSPSLNLVTILSGLSKTLHCPSVQLELSIEFSFHSDRLSLACSLIDSVNGAVCLSIYGSIVLLFDLGRFFSFLFLYTVGSTP
jgi:hypothetical protein